MSRWKRRSNEEYTREIAGGRLLIAVVWHSAADCWTGRCLRAFQLGPFTLAAMGLKEAQEETLEMVRNELSSVLAKFPKGGAS